MKSRTDVLALRSDCPLNTSTEPRQKAEGAVSNEVDSTDSGSSAVVTDVTANAAQNTAMVIAEALICLRDNLDTVCDLPQFSNSPSK